MRAQNSAQTFSAQAGFTLIEILLAMTILGLVMASIFSVVQVGMSAYQHNRDSMEMYQSGRIALRRVSEELRFALSPHAFWSPNDAIELLPIEVLQDRFNGQFIQEEDPGAITFIGQANEVLFVRKKMQLDKQLPFDLQECRIFVDRHNNLVLEVVRSLMMVKQASWLFQSVFEVNLAGVVIPSGGGGRTRFRQIGPTGEPPLRDFIGDFGYIGQRTLIAENIKEIAFRYTDGSDWRNSWDSQELITLHQISPNSPNFNPSEHMRMIERGPPLLVEIKITLPNDDTMITAADVPAGNMHQQGQRNAFQADRGEQPRTTGPERSIRQDINPDTGENENDQPRGPRAETATSIPGAGI